MVIALVLAQGRAGLVDLLILREVDHCTTEDEVDRPKPSPDVVRSSLAKAGSGNALMIGDSRWDIEAAANAGLPTVCVIMGGWSEQELCDHGAAAVYESLVDLRHALDGLLPTLLSAS